MKPKKPIPWRRRTGPYWVHNERVLVKGKIGPRGEWSTFKPLLKQERERLWAELVVSPHGPEEAC